MVDFVVDFKIKSFDHNYMLDALEWIRVNYGVDLDEAEAIGRDHEITLQITYANYNDAITAMTAFRNQFLERLQEFNLKMVK